MEPENGPLEDDIPFGNQAFSCVFRFHVILWDWISFPLFQGSERPNRFKTEVKDDYRV